MIANFSLRLRIVMLYYLQKKKSDAINCMIIKLLVFLALALGKKNGT